MQPVRAVRACVAPRGSHRHGRAAGGALPRRGRLPPRRPAREAAAPVRAERRRSGANGRVPPPQRGTGRRSTPRGAAAGGAACGLGAGGEGRRERGRWQRWEGRHDGACGRQTADGPASRAGRAAVSKNKRPLSAAEMTPPSSRGDRHHPAMRLVLGCPATITRGSTAPLSSTDDRSDARYSCTVCIAKSVGTLFAYAPPCCAWRATGEGGSRHCTTPPERTVHGCLKEKK